MTDVNPQTSSPPAPRIDVVIVNYRAAALIRQHIQHILGELEGFGNSLIHVVDNASPSGDVEVLKNLCAQHPDRIRLILNDKNSGFARGNNLALRRILAEANPPEYIFLLNPDAYPRPGCLRSLVEFMDAHKDAGIVGPRLEGPDGAPQISAFRFFSVASEFETTAHAGPISKLLAGACVAPPQTDETRPADWICGAAALIRREVFEAIGLFDEAYFLYFEETDFMRRAARSGWQTWYAPQARAVHLVGQSSGVVDGQTAQDVRPDYWYQSRKHYFRANHSALYGFCANLAWLAGAALALTRLAASGRGVSAKWRAMKTFARITFAGRDIETGKANEPTDLERNEAVGRR